MFKTCDFWMYSVNLGVFIRKGAETSLEGDGGPSLFETEFHAFVQFWAENHITVCLAPPPFL